jgi:hypothetical protein
MQTPWGESQHVTPYGRGIKFVSTGSHGGFFVPGELLPEMPPLLRVMGQSWNATINNDAGAEFIDLSTVGRWYEEDCEACMVVIAFPLMFEPAELTRAATCFRNWFWKQYEVMSGTVIPEGESLSKDRQRKDDPTPDPRLYASGTSRHEVDRDSEAIAESRAEIRRELGDE